MSSNSYESSGGKGRVALITGGTQGLGRAMAEALLARGDQVAITGRDGDRAATVAAELDPGGERALGLALEVRDRSAFTAAVDEVEDRLGPIEVLVNNAGVTKPASVWEIDDEEWDDVLAVNLRSVLIGCQLVGRRMADRGHGRIVNHASLAGQQGGLVAGAHYAASKAGIIVLTKIFAAELAPLGVTVNAISPAAVYAGPMEGMSAEEISVLESRIPVGRIGQGKDVAVLVEFLTADGAGYITGATYDINGGLFMR